MKNAVCLLVCLAMFCPFIHSEEIVQDPLIIIFPVTLVSPGLANDIVKKYEDETKIPVKMISLCTGDADNLVRAGTQRIDVMLGHAPDAEQKLIGDGYALNYRPVCYSDYVLVGPPEDPAHIKGMASVTEALKIIRQKKAVFLSRGDNSGTHALEMQMWKKAGTEPLGDCYIVTKAGTDATLQIASKKKGYFISHRATYLDMKETIDLDIMVASEDLVTPYHVMAINPQKAQNVDYLNALKFISWITSPKTQEYIYNYGREKYNAQIFFPLREEIKSGVSKTVVASPVSFSGYLQAQYLTDEASSVIDTFSVKRARLVASTKLFDKFELKMMFDGTASPALYDGYISYAASRYAIIKTGQFKVPFSNEYMTSSSMLDTIELSQAVTGLAPQYDMGVSVEGSALKILKYAVCVFNGGGKKADTNKEKDAAGKISLALNDNFELGTAYYAGKEGATNQQKSGTDLYAGVIINRLSLKCEYIIAEENNVNKEGGFLQAMYKLTPDLEVLGRYDVYAPDINNFDNNLYIYTGGLNFYANSNTKVQLNYNIKREKPEIENNSLCLLTQIMF